MFLLHHPRRCYLWLFDRRTTWILTAVQFGLILGEWILFVIVNISQTAISTWSPGKRAGAGLYQSLGTRSSGLYIITVSSVAPALKVVNMIMMYISPFPLIISLRNTNIYEERSIGLDVDPYKKDAVDWEDANEPHRKGNTGLHIQNQLAYDLWWIALAHFLIAVIEEPNLNGSAPGFSLFSILFEIVSAYGNCGLSLGVPGNDYSLSAVMHPLSKLIVVAVMLRGRHRILPMAIDRSILLPGQGLLEEMDRHYNPELDRDLEEEIREQERGSQEELCTGGGQVAEESQSSDC